MSIFSNITGRSDFIYLLIIALLVVVVLVTRCENFKLMKKGKKTLAKGLGRKKKRSRR